MMPNREIGPRDSSSSSTSMFHFHCTRVSGGYRDTFTACLVCSRRDSSLEVQSMEVVHPNEGTVYWEGPVEVKLVAHFSGERKNKLCRTRIHSLSKVCS